MHAVAHPTSAADTYATILPADIMPLTSIDVKENEKPIDVPAKSASPAMQEVSSVVNALEPEATVDLLCDDDTEIEDTAKCTDITLSSEKDITEVADSAQINGKEDVATNDSDDVMVISLDEIDDKDNNEKPMDVTEECESVAAPDVSNKTPQVEADTVEIIEDEQEPKDPEKVSSPPPEAQNLLENEEKSEHMETDAEALVLNPVVEEVKAAADVTVETTEEVATVDDGKQKEEEESASNIESEKKNDAEEVTKVPTTINEDVVNVQNEEPAKHLNNNAQIDSHESKKRHRTVSSNGIDSSNVLSNEETEVPPTKKLCAEIEANSSAHESTLNEYIDKTSNNTTDEIQQNISILLREIHTISDMLHAKELEWNNLLHLKKVKEELVVRLTRKKQVLDIMSSRVGEVSDYSISDAQMPASLGKKVTKELQDSVLNNQNNTGTVTMRPVMSTSTPNATSTLQNAFKDIVQRRANMNSADLLKAKGSAEKVRRNILPKPLGPTMQGRIAPAASSSASTTPHITVSQAYNQIMAQPITNPNNLSNLSNLSILNSYMQAGGTIADLNGHHQQMQQVGRQGAIKDVKSIIADYRQRHPEQVPRRGRRMKSNWERGCDKTTIQDRMSELSFLLTKSDGNSRPSSADSSHSNSNQLTGPTNQTSTPNQSFQDALYQIAKMSDPCTGSNAASNLLSSLSVQQSAAANKSNITQTSGIQSGNSQQQQSQSPLYPEVTLHPVSSQQNNTAELAASASSSSVSHGIQMASANNPAHSTSLLHGILTKNQSRPSPTFSSSFSPTLARLLTAPERITTPANNYPNQTAGINLSKSHSEITITPVVHSQQQQSLQQTLLHQRQQDGINLATARATDGGVKTEMFMSIDDEADDSADRLVIDESDSGANENAANVTGQEFPENEVPECQGCKKKEAQFVCAGCGNQWYCSRDCQVSAWDEHSEECTG